MMSHILGASLLTTAAARIMKKYTNRGNPTPGHARAGNCIIYNFISIFTLVYEDELTDLCLTAPAKMVSGSVILKTALVFVPSWVALTSPPMTIKRICFTESVLMF